MAQFHMMHRLFSCEAWMGSRCSGSGHHAGGMKKLQPACFVRQSAQDAATLAADGGNAKDKESGMEQKTRYAARSTCGTRRKNGESVGALSVTGDQASHLMA